MKLEQLVKNRTKEQIIAALDILGEKYVEVPGRIDVFCVPLISKELSKFVSILRTDKDLSVRRTSESCLVFYFNPIDVMWALVLPHEWGLDKYHEK